jgi:hypothetical protein
MDFDKPYVPSSTAVTEKPDQGGDNPPRKRPSQAVPALFKKKAA